MMPYNPLKSFIIGSSLAVVIHFYLAVSENKNKNYSYESYSIIAPLYFGLVNMLSAYCGREYNWSLQQRLFYTSIISGLFVGMFSTVMKSYNYDAANWRKYYIRILLKHFVTYNLIIFLLEKQLSGV